MNITVIITERRINQTIIPAVRGMSNKIVVMER